MDNFFQPAPINSAPGHLDRLLATWFESNISLAQVARNLGITYTSLLEYVGRPEVRQAIQQARQLMHERYSDTGLELLHEAAQDFRALKGLPENPTPADKDRQRATLNGLRQVSALLAGRTPRRATWPRAPRTSASAPHQAAHHESTPHDRSLSHSATSTLPEDSQPLRPLSALFETVDDPESPDDPPPNGPKGSRAKPAPTPDAQPAPKKTYPPVQVINYLASSTPHDATPPETTAPDRPLCHSTTSPLLPTSPDRSLCHSPTSPLLPDHSATSPLLLHLPPTTAPAESSAPDRPLCHSATWPLPQPPRARSPSLPLAA